MRQVNLKIYGHVQGVFFRQTTKDQADELGLCGWVKNVDDGTVEILVQGQNEKLNKFIQWCKKGPDAATVEKVEDRWQDKIENIFKKFDIIN